MNATHSAHLTQLILQFVLKMATVFTSTRLQSNTPFHYGFANDAVCKPTSRTLQWDSLSSVPRCESCSGRYVPI